MKIIFCLPGNNYSGNFLKCWTDLWTYCIIKGYTPLLSNKKSCNIYYVRQMCLGGDVTRGINQKPFNGEIQYDYLCWIDSDMTFHPHQFQKLLDYKKDIVSGLYAWEGGEGFTCGYLDNEFFKKNGYMEYLTPEKVKNKKVDENGLFKVDYTGFGFILIKYGVFEKLKYPWFEPIYFDFGNIKDFSMEDVGFCIKVKKANFDIFIDPSVRVGHQKSAIY